MEEKIYRKQVFKGGLARTGTEDGVQTAYFSSQALPKRVLCDAHSAFIGVCCMLSPCRCGCCARAVAEDIASARVRTVAWHAPVQDLRDLFRLDPAELDASVTQAQLHAQHGHQRCACPAFAEHLRFLNALPGCAGAWLLY